MKYFDFKDYKKSFPKKKQLNKQKALITSSILIIVVLFIVIFSIYISNSSFREFLDTYILRKNIYQENVVSIDISNDDNQSIFAYDKYICTLNKNILKTYSSSGKEDFEFDVSINNPVYDTNNRFLALAEKNGSKLCLISGQNVIWQKDIEGQISLIKINKNGYISVVVKGTSYKAIVITYNPQGKELFKTYLSTTNAIDIAISNDNKYLSIAEIDSSGSIIQSNIKIISIEKAQNDPTNAVEYIYPATSNDIIIKIKYQDKNKLVCFYDTSIHVIHDNNNTKLIDILDKKDIFADIHLENYVVKAQENSLGLFANTDFQIININNQKENIYTLSGIPKTIYTYEDTIAIVLGTEIHFIDQNGWLIKKYYSTQEIKEVVVGSAIAGVIYKDKIEIINI